MLWWRRGLLELGHMNQMQRLRSLLPIVDCAQRGRGITQVSTFAERVAEAVKRTNHNSFLGDVQGCPQ